jgi:predicted Zn-dependent peptidase
MAHFIEHMLFKGTSNHRAYYILTRLDELGGELNAYTTKEETVVHASVLKDDFEKAIEMLSDIALNSVFPENEILKEKDVIIEEINSWLDNPAELIFDEFEEMVFPGEMIGRNILGTPESVRSFTRRNLQKFHAGEYRTNGMVFCSVGNIDDDQALKLFRKYFESIQVRGKDKPSAAVPAYKVSDAVKNRNTNQSHCIIGNAAYRVDDDRRAAMFLLNNIIGGQGMNSRLNLALREKRGLAYNVESSYNSYSDTGIFMIYFGTDKQNLEKSISITHTELARLRNVRLGEIQLAKAKKQVKGYLARGFEHHESLMLSFARSIALLDRIDSLDEICRQVDNISSSQVLEIANEILNPDTLSRLIYK